MEVINDDIRDVAKLVRNVYEILKVDRGHYKYKGSILCGLYREDGWGLKCKDLCQILVEESRDIYLLL